jgi:ribosome-associated protein
MRNRNGREVDSIPDDALSFRFVRSGGPGGQNVNKVSSAVQLRLDLGRAGLPDAVRARLERIAHGHINQRGELIIAAHRLRSQHQNREDALDRLESLIRQARHVPKKRLPTRPSKAQKHKHREQKQLRSAQKKLRGRLRPGHSDV